MANFAESNMNEEDKENVMDLNEINYNLNNDYFEWMA